MVTFDKLFNPFPCQSYRGDSDFLAYLYKKYENTYIHDINLLITEIREEFEEKTGHPIDNTAEIYSNVFNTADSGISRGVLSPKFWNDVGLNIIRDRYNYYEKEESAIRSYLQTKFNS